MPVLGSSGMTLGVLTGRLRRLKKLAEIVNKDDLAKTLQGMLDELGWPSEADSTEVDLELLMNLQNRFKRTSSSLGL